MPANWIELVPVCSDVYVYQADLICEDCGNKIIKQLKKEKVEDTGDSDRFPQGPHSDGSGEADSPYHCGMNEKCINKVHIPGGVSIGCPLGNPLTSEGATYVREVVARDITDESAHKRRVGRLWAHIYSNVLRDCPLHRIDLAKTSIANSLIKTLEKYKNTEKAKILPEIFTDCSYIYGSAYSPGKFSPITNLWRTKANDTGRFSPLEILLLRPSEIHERTHQDMIEEAISEGAWD